MEFPITADMLVARISLTIQSLMDITLVTVTIGILTHILGPITQMMSLLTMIHLLKTLQSPQVIATRTSSI